MYENKSGLDGLAIRWQYCLDKKGYKCKQDIINALTENREAIDFIPGIGPIGKKGVMAWLGMGPTRYTEHCIRHLKRLGFQVIYPSEEKEQEKYVENRNNK